MLVLDPGLTFHREVIAGVGAFSQAAGLKWVFEIETNILKALASVREPDGFIVDTDASEEIEFLASMKRHPLVCISSAVSSACPAGVSLLASDNAALIEIAIQHLRDAGITNFAFFAKAKYRSALWARERHDAFCANLSPDSASVCWGTADPVAGSSGDEEMLAWLRGVPERTGIIAVNDSSAREILHACNALGRKVPEDIAVVGIDNDPLVAALAPLPISSVIQGAHEIGRKAAELLHCCMRDKSKSERGEPVRLAIPPRGVHPAATSPKTCLVLRDALEYIAGHAAAGIKSEQVADHLGMSRTTLERLFCEHLGYSAHEEILRTRIGMAKQLLLSHTLSTAEVAQRCGFRTQQYMHVVFKRELGLSPREFLLQAEQHSKDVVMD
ncbi:substrate-binding domain-containing protein [Uliginosibacterium sp. 31-16]|uniref:AraC family transcriptional regulator n=1 Tax=Uliginosibacterium sp. 31-16 TaxID=3068315 RepID=UPI00273FA92C|nr:substrate-binding domain-containing protein [Uliginosibacterium sp. 31-16]MDP5241189.1 substrate-binding domain-containing protein [Uliginosibacterium sp. 31-16]